jgi:hypothetical protein
MILPRILAAMATNEPNSLSGVSIFSVAALEFKEGVRN